MTMKRNIVYLALALAAVAFTSCSKEEQGSLCDNPLRANMERATGKTHLVSDDDLNLKWDERLYSEKIYVYTEVGTDNQGHPIYNAAEYSSTEVTNNGSTAEFGLTNGDCLEGANYKAFYPAWNCVIDEQSTMTQPSDWNWFSGTSWRNRTDRNIGNPNYGQWNTPSVATTSKMVSKMNLPSTQYYGATSMRNAPMMAESSSTSRSLDFYNLCGGLDLELKESYDVYVTKIEIITDNQQISGNFDIMPANTGSDDDALNRNHPYLETSQITNINDENKRWNTVVLDCTNENNGDGININTNGNDEGTHFYISLPVGEYNSFYIIVHTNDGKEAVKRIRLIDGNTFDIQRSKFSQIMFEDNTYVTPPGIVPGKYSVDPTHQVYFAHGNLWYAPYLGSPWINEPGENTGNAPATYKWYIAYEQFDNFSYGSDPYHQGNGNPYNWYNTRTTAGSYEGEDVPQQGDKWELYCWSNGTQDNFGRTTTTSTGRNSVLTGGKFVDWGTNPIYNGTSVPNTWRTLTGGPSSEWHYLLMERTTSSGANGASQAQVLDGPHFNHYGENGARWALCRVGGVPGLLIFPDEYEWPDGVEKPYYVNTIKKDSVYHYHYKNLGTSNNPIWLDYEYTPVDWMGNDVPDYSMTRAVRGDDQIPVGDPSYPASMSCDFRKLEMAGFTFLPCVGLRHGDDIRYPGGLYDPDATEYDPDAGWGQDLRYYSASPNGDGNAYYIGVKLSGNDRMDLIFGQTTDNAAGLNSNSRQWGRAVRLVMDVR